MQLLIWLVLAVLVVVAPALVWWQRRQRVASGAGALRVAEARDTVADWPPTLTRVLSVTERQAYQLLRQAVPELMVLAQVPLSRFIRVPTRYSYGEWLGRVGQLSVDLLVCDQTAAIVAVIEIRPAQESERSRQRHLRMTRVLKAAGVRVLVWPEGDLPTPQAVRETLLPREVGAERAAAKAKQTVPGAGPLTAIPVAEVREAGAEPDDTQRDPPPTTWYGDLDDPADKPRR
ncbi:DUF2726 domain-containing protein [Ideonella sp.]|uniref:DUF2726 domain-containing protein n=1 Tax=Ideonella sp. TaxID=1929293 RepID=UPI002B4A32C0|nr:DUF2726 domain-containing protein [Ideonella sp.]HJV69396.1 DUF2726 domain-containing protein [Ideonella sp.]